MKKLEFETVYQIEIKAKTPEDVDKIRGVLEGYGFCFYKVREVREA